jgi:predicted pyridoxine 5'-phosphate oxidase superfamily flavin-nucleotide-binding protein
MHSFTYTDAALKLQERFDTSKLAQAELQAIVHDELTPYDASFVSGAEMFWLATVDDKGSPTVSYKGGAPGFVHVLDTRTLVFPNYDGNGMYWSMGNVATSASIGMLFMNLERPARLRVQGQAKLTDDPAMVGRFPGAQFAITVAITSLVTNCPRYIPTFKRVASSRYVPDPVSGAQCVPGWKRIDMIQGVLPQRDQNKADQEGGLITMDEWGKMVVEGDPRA